jgi:hypothetical protein
MNISGTVPVIQTLGIRMKSDRGHLKMESIDYENYYTLKKIKI